MKKIFSILFLIILMISSCKGPKKTSFDEFELVFLKNWIYADQVTFLLGPKKVIDRPPGVEQLVGVARIPENGGIQNEIHCLYYTVPYKENLGRLILEIQKKAIQCPESSGQGEILTSLENISSFSYELPSSKLKMHLTINKSKSEIDVPLVNLIGEKKFEKYHPIKEEGAIPGLKILKLNEDSFSKNKSKYLGKYGDRFSLGSAIRCQEVDKNCKTIGENRCDECQFGWYEVVDYSCPTGGSKFCGINFCGEKNEPACPRGDLKNLPIEEENSSRGICNEALEPVLNSDHILVCQ